MLSLYRIPTPKTPFVSMNSQNGTIDIEGRSLPENSVEFYAPVLEWIDDFADLNPFKPIALRLNLEYINTSSSKCILNILKRLEVLCKKNWDVSITWYYSDDIDMAHMGLDYKALVACPIEIKKIDGENFRLQKN